MLSEGEDKRRPLWRRVATPVAVLILYCAISLSYWAGQWHWLATRFIGDGYDGLVFVWNPWWLSRCLAHWQNPYFCEMQYAPFGVPLIYHCLTIIPSLIVAGLWHFVAMPLALNIVVLSLCPIGGLCAYALARYVTKDTIAAIAGGVVFTLCPFMTSKLLGHFHVAWAALLPLYTLCLLRAIDERSRTRRAWLTLVTLVILFTNEHTLVFAANITVWCLLYRAVRNRQWRAELRLFAWMFKPLTLFGVVWAGVLAYYGLRYGALPSRLSGAPFAAEPLVFVLPLHVTSVWRKCFAPPDPLGWNLGQLEIAVYVGWLVFPMAVAGWWLRRKDPLVRFMGLLFLCAAVLALGTKLQWHREIIRLGGHSIRMPMSVYRFIPVLGTVGQAGRYMVIGYTAMAVCVASLIAAIRHRFGGRVALGAAVAAIAATCVDYAYRVPTCEPPPCVIGPGPGRVMDPRPGPTNSLYGQTLHGRELVGGYVSRTPTRLRKSLEAAPGLGWFFQRPDRRGTLPTPDEVNRGLQAWDIAYVCVDRDSPEATLLRACGLRLVAEKATDAVFAREPAGDVPTTR